MSSDGGSTEVPIEENDKTTFNPEGTSPAEKGYQVRINEINLASTISRVMERYPWYKTLATLHAKRNLKTLPQKGLFSLGEIDIRKFNSEIFDPATGAIMIEGQIPESELGEFFTASRICEVENHTELRGVNYYISLDKYRNEPTKKIQVISNDIQDGLQVLSKVDPKEIRTEKDYLLYLGVLDYLKMHSITIFHALTYGERSLHIPEDETERTRYFQYRDQSLQLMQTLTRSFYQASIGQLEVLPTNPQDLLFSAKSLLEYLKGTVKPDEFFKFTYPEVNNPLVIMLGAQEAAIENPNIQTIIGVPSGGTETAIATQLAYEYLHNYSPEVLFIALSMHSKFSDKLNTEQLTQLIQTLYPNSVQGKNVLLIDDNANTGSTIQTMSEAVLALGALSESVHLAQHDPTRLKDKYERKRIPFGSLFRFDHPNHKTTMGVINLSQNKKDLASESIKRKIDQFYQTTDQLAA